MKPSRRWQYTPKKLVAVALSAAILAACSTAPETPAVSGLDVTITSPADGAVVNSSTITMSCEIGNAVTTASYSLNGGEPVPLTFAEGETRYSFTVEGLVEGENTVELTVDDDDAATASVTTSVEVELRGNGGDDVASRDLVALNDDNTLVLFNTKTPNETEEREVRGVRGTLLAIDYRPANGLLYGIDTSNSLYVIDTLTGVAAEVSRLDMIFSGGSRSGFDFNPVVDRLRLTGNNDQNLRVNVDTGEVIKDGKLAYAEDDANSGQNPSITASAYRNAFAGTETTALYGIDSKLDVLVLQNPPNDGTLQTIGKLGANFAEVAGFAIFTDGTDDDSPNIGYAVSGSHLYDINITTGKARRLGNLPRDDYRGLAVMPEVIDDTPEGDTPRDMVALGQDNTLVLFNSGDPEDTDERRVRGVRGSLLGIDYRPANGLLYGLSSSNRLYVIDAEQGRATEVSRLNVGFNSGHRSGLDFNPTVDRLRLTGTNDQNFRVNMDTGEVIVDGDLAYADGDANEGKNPAITASAYRNSFAGAMVTELYGIDARLNVLVEQNPPNDGTLITTGGLGFDVAAEAGFDIVTDDPGDEDSNVGYVLSDDDLYKVDLETGATTRVGTVPGGSYRGLAIVP